MKCTKWNVFQGIKIIDTRCVVPPLQVHSRDKFGSCNVYFFNIFKHLLQVLIDPPFANPDLILLVYKVVISAPFRDLQRFFSQLGTQLPCLYELTFRLNLNTYWKVLFWIGKKSEKFRFSKKKITLTSTALFSLECLPDRNHYNQYQQHMLMGKFLVDPS